MKQPDDATQMKVGIVLPRAVIYPGGAVASTLCGVLLIGPQSGRDPGDPCPGCQRPQAECRAEWEQFRAGPSDEAVQTSANGIYPVSR